MELLLLKNDFYKIAFHEKLEYFIWIVASKEKEHFTVMTFFSASG